MRFDRWTVRGVRSLRSMVASAAAITVIAAVLVGTPAGASASGGTPVATSVQQVAASSAVKTADLSGFQPGSIISDAVFFNKGTMTEAQIQAFLQSKVPNCQSGYTCLKDKTDISRTTNADAMCGSYSGGVRESAARIIYKVAQACGINPQVILVTLQKEQGLVTHTWPSEWRYTIAMGQGCPDTAACDTRYYGFFNQVFGAAWQLKRYGNPPGTSNYFNWYAPGRTWNVRFHPNAACGSSPVYIQNQATANLYYYTPYQPNAAALRAGYAAANDACSSYGNRNFYNYFTDWFGSTQTPANACDQPSNVNAASGLYVVDAGTVNVRRAPTTACGDGIRQAEEGLLFARTAVSGDWSRITLDGSAGWVHNDYLTPLAQMPAPSLDLDGQQHLTALDSAGNILVYPLSTSGRWGTATQLATGQAIDQLVALGDFTGNGRRDLIGVDSAKTAWLYPGNGEGYDAPVQLKADWSSARLVASAGDFDGDGVPDVFVVDPSGSLNLWRGDGRGGFTGATRIGTGWGGMTALAGGGDFTGDGSVDLLARTSSGALLVYPGDGRGGWNGASSRLGSGWSGMSSIVVQNDATGDGRADVLARDQAGRLHLYAGLDRRLSYVSQIGAGWAGMRSVAGPGAAITPITARHAIPGVGDVTGDGLADLMAIAGTSHLLYPNNARGGLAAARTISSDWPSGARLVTLGDFNGDGKREIGRIAADGGFWLMVQNGAGGFDTSNSIGRGWGSIDVVVGGIDFDGDGSVDVLARASDGTLRLYRGNGAGGWAGGSSVIGEDWAIYDQIINIGDFDGDGHADVFVRRSDDGTVWLHPTTGAGEWGTARQIGRGWASFTALVGAGDLDGDGHTDVVARASDGALILYRGAGNGGWAGATQIGRGWSGIAQIG